MKLNHSELARLREIRNGDNLNAAIKKKVTGDLRLFGFISVDDEKVSATGRITKTGFCRITPTGRAVLDHFDGK
jgi:hypothetical protein